MPRTSWQRVKPRRGKQSGNLDTFRLQYVLALLYKVWVSGGILTLVRLERKGKQNHENERTSIHQRHNRHEATQYYSYTRNYIYSTTFRQALIYSSALTTLDSAALCPLPCLLSSHDYPLRSRRGRGTPRLQWVLELL